MNFSHKYHKSLYPLGRVDKLGILSPARQWLVALEKFYVWNSIIQSFVKGKIGRKADHFLAARPLLNTKIVIRRGGELFIICVGIVNWNLSNPENLQTWLSARSWESIFACNRSDGIWIVRNVSDELSLNWTWNWGLGKRDGGICLKWTERGRRVLGYLAIGCPEPLKSPFLKASDQFIQSSSTLFLVIGNTLKNWKSRDAINYTEKSETTNQREHYLVSLEGLKSKNESRITLLLLIYSSTHQLFYPVKVIGTKCCGSKRLYFSDFKASPIETDRAER